MYIGPRGLNLEGKEGHMLILTRRINESIMIGDDTSVTVLSVKGNQVRLGIDAPRDVEVHREEIYHRVKGNVPEIQREGETQGNR